MNFVVLNTGTKYLRDASIRLQFPEIAGLDIAEKIYKKPSYVGFVDILKEQAPGKPPYPTVTRADGLYIIEQQMGDIKHQQETSLFVHPIRVYASSSLTGMTFEIHATIFGENLPTPIHQTIAVHCI